MIKDKEKQEFGKWWIFITSLFALSLVMIVLLTYFGILGKTFVEEQVFSNSFQRKAGLDEEKARYEAELAKVNSLMLTAKDSNEIRELNAQKAMLEVLIKTNENKR
jgi:hypothetical protein